jgi:hypothetical protein
MAINNGPWIRPGDLGLQALASTWHHSVLDDAGQEGEPPDAEPADQGPSVTSTSTSTKRYFRTWGCSTRQAWQSTRYILPNAQCSHAIEGIFEPSTRSHTT